MFDKLIIDEVHVCLCTLHMKDRQPITVDSKQIAVTFINNAEKYEANNRFTVHCSTELQGQKTLFGPHLLHWFLTAKNTDVFHHLQLKTAKIEEVRCQVGKPMLA